MKLITNKVKPGRDEVILQMDCEEGEDESTTSTELSRKDFEILKCWQKGVIDKKSTIVSASNHLLCVKKMEDLIEKWIWRDSKTMNASGKVILSEFIGREFNLNYSSLARIFKEEHKMSVETFYILRQTLAAELLLDDNLLTLVEISEALNFCSEQAFSKYFVKHNGLTPWIFRNRIKN